MDWINFEDEPPKVRGDYLIYLPTWREKTVGYYLPKKNRFMLMNGERVNPSHWQELPDDPE